MATRRPCGVCGNTYAENKDGALRKHKCVDALIDVPAVPAAAPDAAAEDAPRWAALLRALPERRSQMAEAALAEAEGQGAPQTPDTPGSVGNPSRMRSRRFLLSLLMSFLSALLRSSQ